METKYRASGVRVHGTTTSNTGGSSFDRQVTVSRQRTQTRWTGWPLVVKAKRDMERHPGRYGAGAHHIFTHLDWGSGFVTERTSLETNYSNIVVGGASGTHPSAIRYSYVHNGPAFVGMTTLLPLYSGLELSNAQEQLYMLGAAAVKRSRPNKPQVDLTVLAGEVLREGVPSLIGSLMKRSFDVLGVFRQGGKEFLNIQFGWAPLVRDLVGLATLVGQTSTILAQYERDVERLVRRRYYFPDQITTDQNSAYSTTPSLYIPQSNTPWGGVPESHISFRPLGQVPNQVNWNYTRTWFSGGFRFYHSSVPEALVDAARFEEQANLLLGVRLDPEALWNLAPWTWLLDWFANFGDVVSNASALADDLVMQYGYLMRTTQQKTEVVWPQGLWTKVPTGSFSSAWVRGNTGPYIQTLHKTVKHRGKASPFGFGLNPSEFTSEQWAILGALGISRVR